MTLKRHLEVRFPSDVIEVVCAWHKATFLGKLMTKTEHPIRQIHYVGHGSGGTLSFSYHHPDAATARGSTAASLPSLPANIRADVAHRLESALLSGYFNPPSPMRGSLEALVIRQNLMPGALMHVWGCFAGAPQHTFDTTDAYWNVFNEGRTSVDGVARHIAKALQISVTAATHTTHGMNYSYRPANSPVQSTPRPCRAPQWLWPSGKARWVTYDSSGTPDFTNINFMGKIETLARIPSAAHPPAWFIKEIPAAWNDHVTAPSCWAPP